MQTTFTYIAYGFDTQYTHIQQLVFVYLIESQFSVLFLTYERICSIFARLREYFFKAVFSHFSTEGVRAKVYFKAIPTEEQNELTFMRVEETKMDFSVKNIQMGVDNVAGGNPVIRECRELFAIYFFPLNYLHFVHLQRLR